MNKKLLTIIALLITSVLISWNLFLPGFFSMHDDLQVMRLYEMKRCLNDGQIPCRWSPDMGAGYGQPMFNYYSATPYYTGALFKSLGFSYLDSTKIVMLLSISLAGIAMFLFLSEFISLIPAFVGGIAYILVPFRALEIFVRGALSENFALALLPLVLFGIVRFIKKQNKSSFAILSLFTGLFLATHNITSLISSILILLFSVALIFTQKNKLRSFLLLSAAALLGLGIASFFLLPVIFENGLVDTSALTSGYFDYHAHFVTLRQLFINLNWGYGASEFGPNDNLSFAVGVVQTLALIVSPFVLWFRRKSLKLTHKVFLIIFWTLGVYYLYLTTSRSVADWEFLSPLKFVQFPWRFLGLVAVCTSAITGLLLNAFSHKTQKILAGIIVFALLILNISYFKFDKNYLQATDETYLSGQGFITQQESAFFDYRPLSMKSVPQTVAPLKPTVISGLAEAKNFQKRSSYFSADIEVYDDEATISFPITNFPNWTVYLNGDATPTPFTVGQRYGEITLTFKKNDTLVQGYFENTTLRSVANIISFTSFLILLVIVLIPNARKNS